MNVEIISKNTDMLKNIWVAARTCKSHKTPEELKQNEVDEKDMIRLAKALKKAGHMSVFEFGFFTFAVSGVSRSLLAQITRHRHLSFCVQSQRAVRIKDEDIVSVVAPESLEKSEGVTVLGSEENVAADRAYMTAVKFALGVYTKLVNAGVPPEDARFILPEGMTTNMCIGMNLRSLLELYEKRVATKGAQWEIRGLVEVLKDKAVESEPWLAELFEE